MVLKYNNAGSSVEVVDCANVQSIGGAKTFTGVVNVGDLASGAGAHALGMNVLTGGPGYEVYNLAVDIYPMMQGYAASHNNLGITFDCFFSAGIDLLSSDAGSNFIINKFSDKLNFSYASGVAQGSSVFGSLATAMYIDTAGDLNCNNSVSVGDVLTVTNDAIVSGHVICDVAGKTLKVASGSDACRGSGATMVGGTVTVSTTAVNTGDIVLLMKTAAGGTSTVGMPVVTIVDGVSFDITGLVTDTSTWSWVIFK